MEETVKKIVSLIKDVKDEDALMGLILCECKMFHENPKFLERLGSGII